MIAVMLTFFLLQRPVKCHFKMKAHSMWYWGSSRGGGGLVEHPKLRKMRQYNTVTWPQNAGNAISKDLNFRNFLGVMPLDRHHGNTFL